MMRYLLITLLAGWMATALAGEAQPLARDPALEARLMTISEELRCLVCQNETLAASRAELAEDLREEIRTMLRAGKTDQEIMDFLVTRYGNFVRYRPPVTPTTWLLWFGPFLLFAGGVYGLVRFLRGRAKFAAAELSAEEHARVQALLNKENTP